MQSPTPLQDDAPRVYVLGATRDEAPALGWSFLYFFTLLAGYYVLRPVRDALGTPYSLLQLFSITFVVMLLLAPVYGALVARYPRRAFLPAIYLFFIACLLAFYVLMQAGVGGKGRDVAFFVWVAVFNLSAVSVFWSFMSDIFDNAQARRLFGAIAAGGTSGTLVGSALTVTLAERIGVPNMLLISAGMLGLSLLCIWNLVPWARRQEQARGWRSGEDEIGGTVLAGARLIVGSPFLIACCGLMFFGVAVGTMMYNHQQAYARIEFPDRDVRVAFFATLDFAINTLVLLLQLFVTRRLLTRYGVGPLLLIPGTVVLLGFALIGLAPRLGWETPRLVLPLIVTTFSLSLGQVLLSIVQILTRAGNFSLINPARESLFTLVDREMRYKSKNFIDTVVYRGGDLSFAFVYAVLTQTFGFGSGGVAIVGAVMALAMIASIVAILRQQKNLRGDRRAGDVAAESAS